jgi:hypothetical protein|tara:strand:- start:738 stop:1097 length:360 start_codon:yes stop_codon:yes gene_type:complete
MDDYTPEEQNMLFQLQTLARGTDYAGERVPMHIQMAALDRYNLMKSAAIERQLAQKRLDAEMALVTDKLAIQKAEVVVKALEVLAKTSIDPERLLEVIQGFTGNLLGGPGVHALEQKED